MQLNTSASFLKLVSYPIAKKLQYSARGSYGIGRNLLFPSRSSTDLNISVLKFLQQLPLTKRSVAYVEKIPAVFFRCVRGIRSIIAFRIEILPIPRSLRIRTREARSVSLSNLCFRARSERVLTLISSELQRKAQFDRFQYCSSICLFSFIYPCIIHLIYDLHKNMYLLNKV